MRRTATIIATATAGLALLSGCAGLQEAADTAAAANHAVTTAQVCLDAIATADFTPDLGDPRGALEQSQAAARDLTDLAAQAGDATVASAIEDLATTLGQVTLADLATPVDWVRQKTEQATALLQACSP